jgi:GNAT superfamily N-acetyltransferase
VAEVDGRIVGYCVVEATFFGHEFVTMVMVAHDARGQGVGTALLNDAQRQCRTTKMFTSTNLSNHLMQRLLARTGWRSAGIVYGLDDDPELFFRAPDHP